MQHDPPLKTAFDRAGAADSGRATPQAAGGRLERLTLRDGLLLILLALALYLPGFFVLPPIDRDEARFAQASRQMLESADFIDISFQDDPRHKKPVGIYWLQSATAAVAGGHEAAAIWAYRLPSLIGAIGAVVATAWLGVPLFGRRTAMLAAVMLAGSLLLGVEARLAKTDAMLLFCIVLAQGCLARAYLSAGAGGKASLSLTFLFWGAIGAGILIKGPIILLVVGGTLLALAVIDRRLGWFMALRPAIGVPIAVLLVAPWVAAITLRTDGQFFQESVGHDLLGKVFEGQESHGAPPGFYLLSVWFTYWPFSLLLALAIPWIWRTRRDTSVRFCLAWILPTWIVFELVVTKLVHYVMPTFPALALLAIAAACHQAASGPVPNRPWRLIATGLFCLITLALGVGLAATPHVLGEHGQLWGILALVVAVAVAVAAVLAVHRRWTAERTVGALLLGAVAMFVIAYAGILPAATRLWVSTEVTATFERVRLCPDSTLAATGYTEPSLVFLAGTDTVLTDSGGAARHLVDDPACAVALVDRRDEPAFRESLAAAGRQPVELARIDGFNYARGDPVSLGLFSSP